MAYRMLPLSTPAGAASRATASSSPSPCIFVIPPTQKFSVSLRGGSFLGDPHCLRLAVSPWLLPQKRNRRPASCTIVSNLPTAKPERASLSGKAIKWSARAIKSFAMAQMETAKMKFLTTGTESLLMGILVEGTSVAAKFLRANGITLAKVREEIWKLLGKGDERTTPPAPPPLTEPAQRALDWAVDEKLKSGENGEVTTTHLLLGIWSEKDFAGHRVLAALGFDDEKAEELAKNANKDFELTYL